MLFLGEAVRSAKNARRKKKGSTGRMGGSGFLNELLGTYVFFVVFSSVIYFLDVVLELIVLLLTAFYIIF